LQVVPKKKKNRNSRADKADRSKSIIGKLAWSFGGVFGGVFHGVFGVDFWWRFGRFLDRSFFKSGNNLSLKPIISKQCEATSTGSATARQIFNKANECKSRFSTKANECKSRFSTKANDSKSRRKAKKDF